MSHVRTQLRNEAIAAIGAALPSLRVEKSRGFGRNLDRLPVAEVSTPSETATGTTVDGLVDRNIELEVTLHVAAGPAVEDQADVLAVGIEKALYGAADFMALVHDLTPESMSFEVQGEGQHRVGQMQLSWACVVQTLQDDPETAL